MEADPEKTIAQTKTDFPKYETLEDSHKWTTKCARLLPAFIVFYSFIKEIKVGEPFLFKYQTEFLNLTSEQIKGEIYPYNPYAYTISLIPIFLLTDLLLYKPTMLVEVLGQIGFRGTLVFGRSVLSQILGIISYGVASASEIAFFSYVYAKLEKDQFRRLTSWTRAGTMGGRTLGYLASQLIIMGHIGDYYTLNVIAFILPCIVLICCILMPNVSWKSMAQRMVQNKDETITRRKEPPTSYRNYAYRRMRKLHSDFRKIYGSSFIRKWSFWWAMTTCMSLQFALLSQTLWGEVQSRNSGESPLNGFAEAAYTAVATLAILGMNSLSIDWDKWGESALVLISSIDAFILVVYSQTQSIYVMYICYIAYRSLYQVMITISQWNIAKKMICESYGLVFGCNSFIAVVMQSILTIVVTDDRGLGMNIRDQYLVYAGCHLLTAFIFLCSVVHTIFKHYYRKDRIRNSKPAQIFMITDVELHPNDELSKENEFHVDVVEEDDDSSPGSTLSSNTGKIVLQSQSDSTTS